MSLVSNTKKLCWFSVRICRIAESLNLISYFFLRFFTPLSRRSLTSSRKSIQSMYPPTPNSQNRTIRSVTNNPYKITVTISLPSSLPPASCGRVCYVGRSRYRISNFLAKNIAFHVILALNRFCFTQVEVRVAVYFH